MSEQFRAWVDALPKIELHIHLEGSIPLDALWELVKKYGGRKEIGDKRELQKRFAYRDFMHFLETWVWKNTFLREYDDFTFIAEAVAHDLRRQNVVYAEMHFSPADFHGTEKKLATQKIAEAVRKGLSKVPGIEIALIGDPDRNFGGDKALRTVHELREVKGEGIVGLGLGGAEKEFPPKDFVRAFDLARESGFRLTVHAGEAAGNESIKGAVELLKAERIGHGTHLTDQALLERIGEAGIGIELCHLKPQDKVHSRDGGASGQKIFDAGLLISVSTDDPAMFGNSLTDEFEALAETHRFTEAEILEVMRRTAASSFMPPEKKAAYAERLSAL